MHKFLGQAGKQGVSKVYFFLRRLLETESVIEELLLDAFLFIYS